MDSQGYFDYALDFKKHEREMQKVLLDWLPDTIIDCHTHIGPDSVIKEMVPEVYGHPMSTFTNFTFEESHRINSLLFPGKNVRAVRFGFPYSGVDIGASNAYVSKNLPAGDKFVLCGLADDIEYTVRELLTEDVVALKMYPWYFIPPATQISQYYPSDVLEVAKELGKPIILHLPIPITECLPQIMKITKDFPGLKIILAHLGLLESVVPGLEEAFQICAGNESIFMDTAMNRSEDVIRLALQSFGSQRILYGSDEPLHLIRVGTYQNPTLGWRFITEYRYHWVDQTEHEQYKHLATDLTLGAFEQFASLRRAIDSLYGQGSDTDKLSVLHDNSAELFGF